MRPGPLTHLSLRRAGYQCGREHTPQPPTNAERYRAFLIAMARLTQLQPNSRDWQFRA